MVGTNYYVATSDSARGLEDAVKEKLAEGWQVQGGVSFFGNAFSVTGFQYAQALTRNETARQERNNEKAAALLKQYSKPEGVTPK